MTTDNYLAKLCRTEGKRIILASGSPRRVTMLRELGLQFEVIPAEIDETLGNFSGAADYARQLARKKAAWVAERHSADLVIAADTIVVKDEIILNKPLDREDARRMLMLLSGASHQVITALCLVLSGREILDHEITEVHFATLDSGEINAYLDTRESVDKAGAYAIQGHAAPFISGISGCYANVVGFPLARFYRHLKTAFTG